jgi:hypothetical protein
VDGETTDHSSSSASTNNDSKPVADTPPSPPPAAVPDGDNHDDNLEDSETPLTTKSDIDPFANLPRSIDLPPWSLNARSQLVSLLGVSPEDCVVTLLGGKRALGQPQLLVLKPPSRQRDKTQYEIVIENSTSKSSSSPSFAKFIVSSTRDKTLSIDFVWTKRKPDGEHLRNCVLVLQAHGHRHNLALRTSVSAESFQLDFGKENENRELSLDHWPKVFPVRLQYDFPPIPPFGLTGTTTDASHFSVKLQGNQFFPTIEASLPDDRSKVQLQYHYAEWESFRLNTSGLTKLMVERQAIIEGLHSKLDMKAKELDELRKQRTANGGNDQIGIADKQKEFDDVTSKLLDLNAIDRLPPLFDNVAKHVPLGFSIWMEVTDGESDIVSVPLVSTNKDAAPVYNRNL